MNTRPHSTCPSAIHAADFLMASRQCEIRNLEYFLQMGCVVQNIGNLVHGLQRERGATNLFLGSGGHRFVGERRRILKENDQLAKRFRAALADTQEDLITHPVSSSLLSHIASALHGLDQLAEQRRRVDDRSVTVASATEWFCTTIHGLIAVVFEAAETAADPAIAGLLVAMVHVMNGKEYCGQERAAGSAGFSDGRFDSALSRRMMHLVEAQERCFEVFAEFANEDSLSLWQALRAHPRELEIERMRQLAVSVGPFKTLDEALADRWFTLMTERMDDLKRIEDNMESAFHQRCVARYTEARHSLTHQESLLSPLGKPPAASAPRLVVCDSAQSDHGSDAWASDGVGRQSGRFIMELLQEQARRLREMSEELKGAREALEDRRTQEKAVLLLMERRDISNDEAHRLLRKLAMDQGRRLPDVARAVVSMAGVLG
ncbi:response regulator receiver protein [Marinobacter fuscus]|uniref:Response regulator receiver protein n=1 Tax=Marinobacter fuscus TaxID=2109942 RepID=A0A2T1KTG1_9GAMM|nr:nitrate- and nitrite sensing domain-containing protein [Marinobacter fuscus]PSF13397.1 response regulator receiver protein [Marinobacter fuscus]